MARVIKKRRTAGEGGYHTTKSGYLVVEIELPRGPDGKRHRKRLYAKTSAELQEKRKAFEIEQGLGLTVDADKLTMTQLLDLWLEQSVKMKNRAHLRSKSRTYRPSPSEAALK